MRTTSARGTPRTRGGDHHRYVPEDLGEGRAVRDGPDDQHRLDPQILERPDRPAVDPRTGGGPRRPDRADQQRAQTLVLEHLTGPLDHVDQQRVPQVGHQDADGLGPDIGQRAHRQVHPVAEFVGGLPNPSPLVLAHHRLAAHHQRDQRLRHPGPLGDVPDRGSTAVRLAASRHQGASRASWRSVGPVQYDRVHVRPSRCCFAVPSAEGRRGAANLDMLQSTYRLSAA